jgi:hypothetical protein
MKKFLITFIILILISGTAFMFGWVQFSVPPGKYGVIHSKTHGVDSELVISGEFRWLWYKLIPTNVKIAVFGIEHNRYPIRFDSALPSGYTYASFAGLSNADFSWNLQGEISFKINPQMLVSLTKQHGFSCQEDLDNYLQLVAKDIEVLILRELSSAAADNQRLEELMSGAVDPEILAQVKMNFPQITDFSFFIHSAKIPDFVLYRMLRHLYEDFLASQREFISTSFGRRAESHIEARIRFEELERYGELLTRFPILLDYLALETNN